MSHVTVTVMCAIIQRKPVVGCCSQLWLSDLLHCVGGQWGDDTLALPWRYEVGQEGAPTGPTSVVRHCPRHLLSIAAQSWQEGDPG